MTKILGLDLGVTSIGWAYISSENNANKILGLGSRIIPLSPNENDEFTKGNAISKNRDRTLKRSSRRNNQRYKLRKHLLSKLLVENNMMPQTDLILKITSLELYSLRNKAVTEQISLVELGRIFLHLNQKRGYKGSPIEESETQNKTEQSNYLELIESRKKILTDRGITVGQYLHSLLQEQSKARLKNLIFPREAYINEFDKIWDTQSRFYPILNTELKTKLRDRIIYYQRPLKSQKHLVSNCRFEPFYKVAPKSSPLFQICKVWESINNISIKDRYGIQIPISIEQKQELFEYLNVHEKISATQLLKKLNLIPVADYFPNLMIVEKGIEGNRTITELLKRMDKSNILDDSLINLNITSNIQNEINKETGEVFERFQIDSNFEKSDLFNIWHTIYSLEPEYASKKIQKSFKLTENQADYLSKIDFKKGGFGNKSTRAIRKILPYLMQGNNYAEACIKAGYKHSDSETKLEIQQRVLADRLQLIPRNSLRNPVVEKILNQLVNLINSIIDNPGYGKPVEIRIELARELKQGIDKRRDTYFNNNKRDAEHKKIADKLQSEFGFNQVSRKLIEKYKLGEEVEWVSLYTGKKIDMSTFLRGEIIDVEHIIPSSRLFDDSFLNKTICETDENRRKGNMTAYDYMKSKGEEHFNAYIERVTDLYNRKKISFSKRDKLLMPVDKIPEDFINRQLRETQYIAKESITLLKQICRHVYSTSGSVTDYLRHIWGYDDVLQNLNFEKYEKIGKTETIFIEEVNKHKKRIVGWSKRDDHRHHALDALVIASTSQRYIQQLNKLNQLVLGNIKKIDIKTEQPYTTKEVESELSKVLVSFKSGKKVATKNKNNITGEISFTPRGFLHKETVYGKVKQYEKVKLSQKFTQVEQIVDEEIKLIIENRLAKFNNDSKLAFKNLEKDPIWIDSELTKKLTEVTIFSDRYVVKTTLGPDFKTADALNIVDAKVKAAVLIRLAENDNNPKEAFRNLIDKPIWLNEKEGLAINSVRLFVNYEKLTPLHKNTNGEDIDFVVTRNNHHIAIYEDATGKRIEEVVTFWEAVERKKQGTPIIQHHHPNGHKLILTLQLNEMVVFDLDPEEIDFLDKRNYALISPNIYRVQKIGTKYYTFRHHLETKLEDTQEAGQINKYKRMRTIEGKLPVKVKLNYLGEITHVY